MFTRFFTAFLSFFCSQSKPQGAWSLWDQIDVHVQCGSQRRSDWMDSVKVGKRGRGRVFTDQSHRVLCQTFLQRHGQLMFNLLFNLLFNLVQHKIVFGLFLGDHPRGGDFRWCNKYMWKYLRGGKFYFPRIYTEANKSWLCLCWKSFYPCFSFIPRMTLNFLRRSCIKSLSRKLIRWVRIISVSGT